MRRRNVGWLMIIALIVGLAPQATLSQEAALPSLQPADTVSGLDMTRIPGVVEAVGRSFDNANRSSAVLHLEFAVLAFPDSDAASDALPDVFSAQSRVFLRDARRTASPPLGDTSAAWEAVFGEFASAVLLVQDGPYIHVMSVAAEGSAPLDVLVSIAETIVGRNPATSPVATPIDSGPAIVEPGQQRPLKSGGLWDMLPVYEDLPGHFVLYIEEAWTR